MEKEQLVSMVTAAQSGQEEATTALYYAFYQDIYYYIFKTVNDRELAADLTQDTFIEILQTIGSLKEPAAFVTWSRQIAYHKCTAYFKKRHELLADEDEDGNSVFDTLVEDREEFIPGEALDKEELKQTILAMINALPEEQRSAIFMRYFEEMSVKDIAQIQGVTEGTVKSRLNYGRKAIKQSMESYEKKHDVKLHCAGVVPLLLWLFHQGSAAGQTAAAASATTSAASAAATAATTAAKAGAKAAGGLVKKIIAAIAAAAVVTGGVVAGVALQKEPEPEPEPEPPLAWWGYGDLFHTYEDYRFDLTAEEMTDEAIRGHLEVTHLYEDTHITDFEGTGTADGDRVTYEIVFDTPYSPNSVWNQDAYTEMTLTYDKSADRFAFDDIYRVSMDRVPLEETVPILAEGAVWSGYGEDSFAYALAYTSVDGHLFVLEVDRMTCMEISGKLTASYKGNIDHESNFTGRGYEQDGKIYYEVLLETPRTQEYFTTTTFDRFRMVYDCEKDTFDTTQWDSLCYYKAIFERQEEP